MQTVPMVRVVATTLVLFLTTCRGIEAQEIFLTPEPPMTFIDTQQCKNLQDIRNLIPLSTLKFITAKHCMYDAKFRHSLKFLKSDDFQNVLEEIETSEVYESLLNDFANAGMNTMYLSHIGDIFKCLLVRPQMESTTTTSAPITTTTTERTTTTTAKQIPNGADDRSILNSGPIGGAMEIAFMLKLGGFAQYQPTVEPSTIAPNPAGNSSEITPVDDCDEYGGQNKTTIRTISPENIALSTPAQVPIITSKPIIPSSTTLAPFVVTNQTPVTPVKVEISQGVDMEEWDDSSEDVVTSPSIDSINEPKSTGSANITETDAAARPSVIMARSVKTYLRDIILAMPQKQLRELLVEKVCEDAEFANFYKLMRSRTFKLNILRSISSPELKNQVEMLKQHYINLRTVVTDIFAIFEMGPLEI